MTAEDEHLATLIKAATAAELRHFALGLSCHRAWPFVFEACSLNHAFILLKDLKVLRSSG
jgi:hypothetical protein